MDGCKITLDEEATDELLENNVSKSNSNLDAFDKLNNLDPNLSNLVDLKKRKRIYGPKNSKKGGLTKVGLVTIKQKAEIDCQGW